MRGWISVKNEFPKDGVFVLCYTAKFGNIGSGFGCYEILFYNSITKTWENYETDDFENNPDYIQVTHWKKLPDKPILKQKNINILKIFIKKLKLIIQNLEKDMFG
jgi:hypothetical protein